MQALFTRSEFGRAATHDREAGLAVRNHLAMAGTGIGLFAVTVVALLGVQGRLTHEGTKHIPLLHSCFPTPEAPAPRRPARPVQRGTRGAVTGLGEKLPERDEGVLEPLDPHREQGVGGGRPGGQPEGRVKEARPAGDRLFDFDRLLPGISVEELDAALAHARRAAAEVVAARAELDERAQGLEARERDLEARQEQILRLLERVETERARVEARIAAFDGSAVVLRQDQEAACKAAASTVASLEPEVARALIEDYWRTAEGQAQAVRILAVMEPRRADAILGLLDTAVLRQILERRMSIVRGRVRGRGPAPAPGAASGGPGNE